MRYLILLLLFIQLTFANIIQYVDRYSRKEKIDKRVVLSLIEIESSGDRKAISYKNCIGLMQVSIMAYNQYYQKKVKKGSKVALYFLKVPDKMKRYYLKDEERNIRIGVWYLRYCLNIAKGNYILALNYYIIGKSKTDKTGQVAFEYINDIIDNIVNFE